MRLSPRVIRNSTKPRKNRLRNAEVSPVTWSEPAASEAIAPVSV
jgi:hypothetical protein